MKHEIWIAVPTKFVIERKNVSDAVKEAISKANANIENDCPVSSPTLLSIDSIPDENAKKEE